ncbi:MAG: peptidoglycan D,D-transpeptidase FtsI family protein [Hyphomicrobiaceae bacterium]
MKRRPEPLRVGPALTVRPGAPRAPGPATRVELPRGRTWLMHAALASVFIAIAGQTVRLAASGEAETRLTRAEPLHQTYIRPDIVDRRGNLLATDVDAASLFADPAMVRDADLTAEKLVALFPELDAAELRRHLADGTRRFMWIKRGLTPIEAQRAHDLGLPGLGFRREPRRVYPTRFLTSHIIGQVDVDNRGISGIERHIDELGETDVATAPRRSQRAPVRLSIDLGVQNAVADTLADAMKQYKAQGASGIILDVASGEIIAAVSLPNQDVEKFPGADEADRFDRVAGGVFELGSIAKIVTLGLALDDLGASLTRIYDTREPLRFGRYTISEQYPPGRPLTLAEILVRSSNVGAGLIAMEAGVPRQRAFLDRVGLLETIRTEAGRVAPPLLPANWGPLEGVTIAYGHGLAVAPLQFAAAAAGLVNGGIKVRPTLIQQDAVPAGEARVVSPAASAAIREALRRVVTDAQGTGRRAEIEGYEIGGKTGTAEQPGRGGYSEKTVISSFLAVLPASAPRYVLLLSLFEPHGTMETRGRITAGLNAAPTTARLIARIGPMLGLLPARLAGAD